jgi:hypothetical protein
MRNTANYGLMVAALLATKIEQQRKRPKRVLTQARELTEVERWNAAVEARKAEKKAKRAASKESGNGN